MRCLCIVVYVGDFFVVENIKIWLSGSNTLTYLSFEVFGNDLNKEVWKNTLDLS